MTAKFNSKLAVEMIKNSSSVKANNVSYYEENDGIWLYSYNRFEFGSFQIIAALEAVGFSAYATVRHIEGAERIAIRIF